MANRKRSQLEDIGGLEKLAPKELELMQIIWDHPEGISTKEIYAQSTMNTTTKSTIISNIANKGYLRKQQQGLHFFYNYTVSRTEYERAVLRQQLRDMKMDSSLPQIIATFLGREKLTEKQKIKVQELLEDLERDSELSENK